VSDSNIAGSGFVLVDQAAVVLNLGVGIANSGLNTAVGNASQNGVLGLGLALVLEAGDGNFNAEDVVAANTTTAANNSNGSASVDTGDTEAIGNQSTTTVNQVADTNITGAGFDLVDSTVLVVNAGLGVANSGLNQAVGNASQNAVLGASVPLILETGDGDLNIAGDAVVANTQTLANNSNGSASITTGEACAYGNISTTTAGEGLVLNLGLALANSGLNTAVGNASANNLLVIGAAAIAETGAGDLNAADDVVVANTVSSSNWSDGSANIKTGLAMAIGNTSTTFATGDSVVVNFGIGLANTGLNTAVANASNNGILSIALAGFVETGAGDLNLGDDAVASNVVTETNTSNGRADIDTGDAYALGNRSATGIVDGEDNLIVNFGLAFANSGLNIGAGNTSNNQTLHLALAISPGGVATNVANLSNTSDGSANIKTGNANAFGNIASNAICQGVDFGPLCPQPVLPPAPFPCCLNKPPVVPGGPTNPPVGPTPPGAPVPPGKPVPPVLARTGASVEGLALLGLLLLAIGVFLRRKARTA
jgi:LPXTG-motif cell wall-anchored protein